MNTLRTLVASAVLGMITLAPPAIHPLFAQQHELPIDKILEPLPEFNPFESDSASAPKYFPDEVDKKTRELLIDALVGHEQVLPEHLEYFKNTDDRIHKDGVSTGITPYARDLVNNTIRDRERFIEAQKRAMKEADSPARKKYLEAIISHDDLIQSDALRKKSSTNLFGGMLNRMLGSVDLVGVASGNYVGAAVETAVNQMILLGEDDMAIEQRRALARDLDHLRRYPEEPGNAEVRKRVAELDAKKRAALAKKQLKQAESAWERKDFERAQFHAQLALMFDEQSERGQRMAEDATKARQIFADGREKSLKAAAATASIDAKNQRDRRKLLQALSLRDPIYIQKTALEVEHANPGTPLADAARDAEAVAMEIKGWHDAAQKAVEQLARSASTGQAKERAEALLRSPEYNQYSIFKDARTDRQLQTAKYVLFGEEFFKKNLLYAAGAMAAAGPAGAATLGTINAILMSNNLYQVVTQNPVSAQPVIDAGVAYIRNHPNAGNTGEIFAVLGNAYEEKGMLEKAVHYYEMAGLPQDKIAAVKAKSAKAMLARAERSGDRGAKEHYLTSIIDRYPDSPAAKEATRKLADMARNEQQGLRMSKQFLRDHPELYGNRGLGLKASLFDGDPKNMEIADRGINLIGDNEVKIYFQTPWGVRSQTYQLASKTSERFFVTLREKNHQVALADVNRRAKGSIGGIGTLPSSVVKAENNRRGEDAESRDATTIQLIRQAGGAIPEHAKVLDADLLSENERNPAGKYKLPPIQGSISASRFSMTGAVPMGFWGNQIAAGGDSKGAFAGVQLPIPLLEGFIPVDFMVQGRPGGVSVYPRIRTGADSGEDPELYK